MWGLLEGRGSGGGPGGEEAGQGPQVHPVEVHQLGEGAELGPAAVQGVGRGGGGGRGQDRHYLGVDYPTLQMAWVRSAQGVLK